VLKDQELMEMGQQLARGEVSTMDVFEKLIIPKEQADTPVKEKETGDQ
jgi:hypothetical protein